jgi:hypothetical protein
MHSLLDIELATRLDRERNTMRVGSSLRSLIHRLHQG